MTTSFPMYLRPETADAHRSYYALIRRQLDARALSSPAVISEPADLYAHWKSPDLFLSQTCGMPYRVTLHNKVQLVGTPDFQLKGCKPGHYHSAVVVRHEDKNKRLDDFKDSIFTFNSDDSQSGYAAAYHLTQKLGFWFQKRVPSGSHSESCLAIAEGRADIATIDAMTWRILKKFDPFTNKLSVIGWTDQTPGLPYITSTKNDAATLFGAISAAIEEMPADLRQQLNIHSIVKIPAEEYLAIDNPPT